MKKNTDLGLLILRISIGGLMLFHGVSKLMVPAQTVEKMAGALSSAGLPSFLSYGVFLGEVIAPLLILVGFRTRISALLVAITMVVATFVRHSEQIFDLSGSGGLAIELQLLYLLGGLALTFTGSGKYAISHKNILD